MDIADIRLIIQWRATCRLETLWQRFGCAVRNRELTGKAVLFAEKDHFDDERILKAARKVKNDLARTRKAEQGLSGGRPHKRTVILGADGSWTAVNPVPERDDGGNDDDRSRAEGEANDKDKDPSMNSLECTIAAATAEGSVKQVVAMAAIPGLVGIPVNASRQKGGPERRLRRVLDPGVDCFINADHRADLKCRHKVFDTYFNNTLAGGNFFLPSHACCFSTLITHTQSLTTLAARAVNPLGVTAAISVNQLFAVTFTTQRNLLD